MLEAVVMPLWLWVLLFFGSIALLIISITQRELGYLSLLSFFFGLIDTITGSLVGEMIEVNNVLEPVFYTSIMPFTVYGSALVTIMAIVVFLWVTIEEANNYMKRR